MKFNVPRFFMILEEALFVINRICKVGEMKNSSEVFKSILITTSV
jgi:hypothetical protein